MKLLFCGKCGDIIAPLNARDQPRSCVCGRLKVWWSDPEKGILRVHDVEGPTIAGPTKYNEVAWVLGINNSFLLYEGRITAEVVKQIDDDCPDNYLFKRVHSPLIRFRPGETSDTAYAELPKDG